MLMLLKNALIPMPFILYQHKRVKIQYRYVPILFEVLWVSFLKINQIYQGSLNFQNKLTLATLKLLKINVIEVVLQRGMPDL